MTSTSGSTPDIYSRVVATLRGEQPERLAFIDRLELWYASHSRAGTLPEQFKAEEGDAYPSIISPFTVPIPASFRGMRLTDVHRAVGMGQQLQTISHARRLCGVELVLSLNGEVFFHEREPVIEYFPRLFGLLKGDQPGETVAEYITPLGTLTCRSMLAPETIQQGGVPIMTEPPLKGAEDYPAFEYIFEHAEYVPCYEQIATLQERMGSIGFVVPMLNRLPFQQLVLDHVGEVNFFYMLHDNPALVEKMMALLDRVMLEDLRQVAAFDWPYIQFDDNLDGMITNPRLFRQYCLPNYQRYIETLHAQGKKVGSHTDGNLMRLLGLLVECGLDVCESFSPAPLTECTFDEAWAAWAERGPLIWGGIPSPLLEERTNEGDFRLYIDHLFELIGSRPIILGIGDMVMPNNSIDRVRAIAERVEHG